MKSEHGIIESVLFSGVRVNGDYAPVIQDYNDCKDIGFKRAFYDETDCIFNMLTRIAPVKLFPILLKSDFPEGTDCHK